MIDRRIKFVESNDTVCQEGCYFAEYNNTNKMVKCTCKLNNPDEKFENMVINMPKFYEQFNVIKKPYLNFHLLSCYKEFFKFEEITNNICFLLVVAFVILHFIVIIIFCANQKKKLDKIIKDIAFAINNYDLIKDEEKKKKKNINEMLTSHKNHNKNIINKKNRKSNETTVKSLAGKSIKIKKSKNNFPPKRKSNNKIKKSSKNSLTKNIFNQRKETHSNSKIVNKNNNENEEMIKKIKQTMAFTLEEINTLPFELALKHDKREYCDFYLSLIKTKHILVFIFFTSNDYNSKIVKIELVFITFIIGLAINGLFFNYEVMHKIYCDKGCYYFLMHLPPIIISGLISYSFFIVLRLFALSEGKIIDFKSNKTKADLNKRINELNKKLNIQYILYFIFVLILLLLFGYYLAIFGSVYKYSQKYLIINGVLSLVSIFLSVIPFISYLGPVLFRMFGLSSRSEIGYKICLLQQLFV